MKLYVAEYKSKEFYVICEKNQMYQTPREETFSPNVSHSKSFLSFEYIELEFVLDFGFWISHPEPVSLLLNDG